MIPPQGFKSQLYPLRHKLLYSFGLSAVTVGQNSACPILIMGSTDMSSTDPDTIKVNPHNTNYVEDSGPLVRQMSIIDRMRISIRFNLTSHINDKQETASSTFTGDGLHHIRMLWRPIFFSFPEKLAAADDDTGNTVATILALTSDDTNQDVVPLTTNDLPTTGGSAKNQPISTVNDIQVFGDFNMTTNLAMEDHVWDEELFQNASRRFTNRGALKACVGRTRFVNLTRNKPFQNFFINQFVPRAVRRVVDRTFMALQIHVPVNADISQDYTAITPTANVAHIGCKIICTYHEWNNEHNQDMQTG